MGVQQRWIEHPGGNRINRGLHTEFIDFGIAFMRVDDIQAAPIPELHIYLPRPILMIASDDQSASFGCELGGKIERPLFAHGFDHCITKSPLGQLLDRFYHSPMIV